MNERTDPILEKKQAAISALILIFLGAAVFFLRLLLPQQFWVYSDIVAFFLFGMAFPKAMAATLDDEIVGIAYVITAITVIAAAWQNHLSNAATAVVLLVTLLGVSVPFLLMEVLKYEED